MPMTLKKTVLVSRSCAVAMLIYSQWQVVAGAVTTTGLQQSTFAQDLTSRSQHDSNEQLSNQPQNLANSTILPATSSANVSTGSLSFSQAEQFLRQNAYAVQASTANLAAAQHQAKANALSLIHI